VPAPPPPQKQFFFPLKTGVDADYTVVHGHFGCIQFPTTTSFPLDENSRKKRIRFSTTAASPTASPPPQKRIFISPRSGGERDYTVIRDISLYSVFNDNLIFTRRKITKNVSGFQLQPPRRCRKDNFSFLEKRA
jgi:hypothetical protein